MSWLLIGALVWVAVAVPAALMIGRGVRLADARRTTEFAMQTPDGNFVASDVPPADAATVVSSDLEPEPDSSALWTGPTTLPFTPPPPLPRQRPPVVRDPVSRVERDPARDSGLL
jgi:hypothetical protein